MPSLRFLLAVICIAPSWVSDAKAASRRETIINFGQSGMSLSDSDLVVAPRAFQNFCRNRPDQCRSHGNSRLVQLDARTLAELRAVDLHVNRAIRPLPAPAGDAYELGVSAGSCNEYAVEKRRELLAKGWSAASLSLAVVRLPDGRGHLVLTVRTNRGDLVLDNLADRIVAVDQTSYAWIERQSTIHPMLWVRIGGFGEPSVEIQATRAAGADAGATALAVSEEPL